MENNHKIKFDENKDLEISNTQNGFTFFSKERIHNLIV